MKPYNGNRPYLYMVDSISDMLIVTCGHDLTLFATLGKYMILKTAST